MRAASAGLPSPRYPRWLRVVHLALACAVLCALVSGQFAGDYRQAVHAGFDVHRVVGLCAAGVVGLRWMLALAGPSPACLRSWQRPLVDPREWWRRLLEALASGLALEAPHAGLAGVVQFLMLLAVAAMATTGIGLALMIEPGSRAVGAARALKEVHEAIQPLLWTLLGAHVAAGVAHQAFGHAIVRAMFSLRTDRIVPDAGAPKEKGRG